MDYRTRFLNTLRGKPVDRLPFVETAQFNMARACSDWNAYLGDDQDPREVFGFDNVQAPKGYEPVPVDWYAVPRFRQRTLLSTDGCVRTIDGQYGSVNKAIPEAPGKKHSFPVRVFEQYVVESVADWFSVKERFHPSVNGRFPRHWERWCENSRTATHPIVLELIDPAAALSNLMGFDGDTRLVMSTRDRPALVDRMVAHFCELSRCCADKALSEARVDMVIVGSDVVPMLGPKVLERFFSDAYADSIARAKAHGIDLFCLRGRGDLRAAVSLFRRCGANGLQFVVETGGGDYLAELLEATGDEMFYLGWIDGRILLQDEASIEEEVDRKVAMATRYRAIPNLHATQILPDVQYEHHRHYAQHLWYRVSSLADPEPEWLGSDWSHHVH